MIWKISTPLRTGRRRPAMRLKSDSRPSDTYIHGSCNRLMEFRIPQVGIDLALQLQEKVMSLIRWEPFGDVDTLINRLMPASFASVALAGNGRKLDWSPS